MAEIVWTDAALEDLREIYEFIAQDSEEYAQVTADRIYSAAQRLEDFPRSGRVVPERPSPRYREVLTGAYRVVYRYDDDRNIVFVVAVVHGSRQLPPIGDGPA